MRCSSAAAALVPFITHTSLGLSHDDHLHVRADNSVTLGVVPPPLPPPPPPSNFVVASWIIPIMINVVETTIRIRPRKRSTQT